MIVQNVKAHVKMKAGKRAGMKKGHGGVRYLIKSKCYFFPTVAMYNTNSSISSIPIASFISSS